MKCSNSTRTFEDLVLVLQALMSVLDPMPAYHLAPSYSILANLVEYKNDHNFIADQDRSVILALYYSLEKKKEPSFDTKHKYI